MTVHAGTIILGNGVLDIFGTLNAAGTATQPVTFTSANVNPQSGDWPGLRFEPNATGTMDDVALTDAALAIGVNHAAVRIHDSLIAADQSGISNCAGCTVVHAENNYWGDPSGPAPGGSGPSISSSTDVSVSPWLTSNPLDPRSFATSTPTNTATPTSTATPMDTPAPTNSPTVTPTALVPTGEGPQYDVTASSGATVVPVPNPTDVGNHCDDCSTLVQLPFPVKLYNGTFTAAYVTSNGQLDFTSPDADYASAALPDPNAADAIFAHWDDLRTDASNSGIFMGSSGSVGSRTLYIEWRATYADTGHPLDIELVMYENSPTFDIVYGSADEGGANAVVGVQQGIGQTSVGQGYTQVEADTAGSLAAGLDLHFSFGSTVAPTYTPTPTDGPTGTDPIATPTATSTPTNVPPNPGVVVTVPAMPTWVNTGLTVMSGQNLTIAASGSWWTGDRNYPSVTGPDGYGPSYPSPDNFLNRTDIGQGTPTTQTPGFGALIEVERTFSLAHLEPHNADARLWGADRLHRQQPTRPW